MASVNSVSLFRTPRKRSLSVASASPRVVEELPCSPLENKTAAIVRTGNEATDIIREGQRADFVQIVRQLAAHPERVSPALEFLRRMADDANGPKTSSVWKPLPKTGDMVNKLVSIEPRPSELLFGTMQRQDDSFVFEALQMLTQIPSVMPIPQDFRDDPNMFW